MGWANTIWQEKGWIWKREFPPAGLEMWSGWFRAPLPSLPCPLSPWRGACLGRGVCVRGWLGSGQSTPILPVMVCCSLCLRVSSGHGAYARSLHLSLCSSAPWAVPAVVGGLCSFLLCRPRTLLADAP